MIYMKMKRGLGIAAVMMAACLVLSCSEKKQSNVIIAPKPVKQAPKAPAKMDEFKHTDDVPWLDKTYKVEVHRFVADSLPKVKDEQGNPYFDNLIRVRVLRADGSEFFNRVFSKKSFNDYLDENTRKTGALLGIVFDHAEGDNLYLGASVGSPDRLSDEYIPLILTISRMGDVGIKRDTKIDSDVPEEEEEGV